MAQKKEGSEKKAGVKIQDLSPRKDAKGGAGIKNSDSLKNSDFKNSDSFKNQDSVNSSSTRGQN